MRCLIIEDEPKAIDVLHRYADRMPDIELSGSFRDPLAALSFLKKNPTDLVFLDINLPGLSGLQLLNTLENPPLVIFTTAYPDYAVQSYELEAVDYLLKPITFGRFEKAVAKAAKAFQAANNPGSLAAETTFITLKSGAQTHRIKTGDILFLKKEGNYFTVFTQTQKIVIRQNMESALRLLPANDFVRVHRSYIVSLRHVRKIGKRAVQVGDFMVPVSLTYRQSLPGANWQFL